MSPGGDDSRVGTRIGPYLLKRLLGRGGMGEVYVAEDTVRERTVALKLMAPAYSQDPVFRKRLQREARSAGKLSEPHVVPIHDYGEVDGHLFVDMRLIEGVDLATMLAEHGPMPPPRAVAIVRQIASALDAAHGAGVMHRDVKPANILIASDDFACLVDFGIASAATEEKLTRHGDVLGTFAYMSPERLTGDDEKITHRADIYALACVLYEAVTGAPPYRGAPATVMTAHIVEPVPRASEARPGIPRALDEVIAKGMAKEPGERHLTAGDFAVAAHRALTTPDQDRAAEIINRTQVAVLRDPGASAPRMPAAPPPRGWHTPPPGHRSAPPPSQPSAPPLNQPSTPPPAQPSVPPFAAAGPPSGPTAVSYHQAKQPWQGPIDQSQPSQPAWAQSTPPEPPKRSKTPAIVGGVGAVLLVIVVVAAVILWPKGSGGGGEPPPDDPQGSGIPLKVLNDGVEVGSTSAPVTIDVFDEPICPPCGQLISSSADDLAQAVTDEKVAVRYHLLNFLDGESGSRTYSSRAIAASLCVADTDDGKLYMDYYHALFESDFQPREGALTDRTDRELADLAERIGAPESVRTCIENDDRRADAEDAAAKAGKELSDLNDQVGTPAVFQDGILVNTDDPNWVDDLG